MVLVYSRIPINAIDLNGSRHKRMLVAVQENVKCRTDKENYSFFLVTTMV